MRAYAVALPANTSLTAAATGILGVQAAANKPCIIVRAALSQSSNTTSTQQGIQILRRSTTSTSVATPTKNPMDGGDAAASFTALGVATALGTAGAVLYEDSFNWQNGWLWLPVPEERHYVTAVITEWSLSTSTTPPALNINSTVDLLELGG
jgi:hypothetical protein